MINTIPASWIYTSNLENLLFFYQCSEELLSYNSPDSFRLPVCNSMTLCPELRRIYKFLRNNKQVEKYYSKYIPCIIDELIKSINNDHILKHKLGLRLESAVSGLTSAKETPQELVKWVCIIEQSCPLEQHAEECRKAIIQNMQSGNNKSLLLWLAKNYYIDLIALGYSTEFLYQSVIRYFDNRDNSITSSEDIITFLDHFDGYNHSYEFFVVADTYKLDNLSRINPQIGKSFHIEEIDEERIIELKQNDGRLRRFYSVYEDMKKRGDPNIKMLSCKADGADPYSAFMDISQTFDLAQFFESQV